MSGVQVAAVLTMSALGTAMGVVVVVGVVRGTNRLERSMSNDL